MTWTVALWGLGIIAGIVMIGVLVALAESIMHHRKQDQYDELHRGMGLDPKDPKDFNR
jgi:hypothetical protein